MSKRTHDDRKKIDDSSPFKIPNKEMILTRGRSIKMRRQLRHKDFSSKSTGTRTSPKSAKLSPKPVNRLPPSKDKTSPPSKVSPVEKASAEKAKIIIEKPTNSIVKVTLKPKMKKIDAKMESKTTLNKRKSNCPQKRSNVNVSCKDGRAEESAAAVRDKRTLPETRKGKTLKQRCLEDERMKRGRLADVIRLRERTETLTDEDLLEIVQCPSPVWWEEQSERVDRGPFIAEQPADEKGTPQKAENKLQPPAAVPLNVARIPDSDCDQEFVSKRSSLENVLFGLKTKGVSKDSVLLKSNLDKGNSSLCKPNRNVDINADQPTLAANALRDVMMKKMHAHLPKIRGVTENCMRFIRIKPVQAKKVYSGNDSAELIPYKGVKEVDIIDLSDEVDEQKDTEKTNKTKHAGAITDEHEVLKDLENLQIPIDNQVCIVIDEEENESFLGISESSQTQTKPQNSINNMETDLENIKNISDQTRLKNLHLEMKSENFKSLSDKNLTQERSKNKENVSAATEDKNEGKGVKRKSDDDLDKDPKRKCLENDLVGESREKSDAVNLYLGDDSEIDASLSDCDQMSDTNMQFVHEDQLLDEATSTVETDSKTNFLTKEVQSDSNDSNAGSETSKKSESVMSKIKRVYRELITNMKNKNTGKNQTPFEPSLNEPEENKLDTENVNAIELELDGKLNENEYNHRENKTEEVQVKIEQTHDKTEELQDQTQLLQVKIEELQDKPDKLQYQSKKLQDKPDKLQDQSEELQEKPEKLQDKLNELEEKTEELQDKPDELKDKPKESQDKTEELQEKPDELQDQSEELQEKPKKLQDKLNELQEKTEELQDKTEKLKDNPEESQDKTEELRNQIEELQDKPEELQDKPEELHDKRHELHETVEETHNKTEELQDQTERTYETREELQDPVEETHAKTEELEDQTEKTHDKTEELQNKTEELQEEETQEVVILLENITENELKEVNLADISQETSATVHVFTDADLESGPITYEFVTSENEILKSLDATVEENIDKTASVGIKDLYFEPDEPEDEEDYKHMSLISAKYHGHLTKEMIENIIGVENRKEVTSPETLEQIVLHGVNPLIAGKKDIVIAQNENLKYCYKCSSLYDTDKCSYCQYGLIETPFNRRGEYFYCDQCPFQTKRQRSIHEHVMKHKDTRPFSCDVCKDTFKTKITMRIHLEQHCLGGDKPKFTCDACEATFNTKSAMRNHFEIAQYCKGADKSKKISTTKSESIRVDGFSDGSHQVKNRAGTQRQMRQVLDETTGYLVTLTDSL